MTPRVITLLDALYSIHFHERETRAFLRPLASLIDALDEYSWRMLAPYTRAELLRSASGHDEGEGRAKT